MGGGVREGGAVALGRGFPGVGMFIWTCSHQVSQEPDFTPVRQIGVSDLALPSAQPEWQAISNISLQPLTHRAQEPQLEEWSPSSNSNHPPSHMQAERVSHVFIYYIFISKHFLRDLQDECQEPHCLE